MGFVSAFCYARTRGALLFTEKANFGSYHGFGHQLLGSILGQST